MGPEMCTAQSFETAAVLEDPALLLRVLAAVREQMTQARQSDPSHWLPRIGMGPQLDQSDLFYSFRLKVRD